MNDDFIEDYGENEELDESSFPHNDNLNNVPKSLRQHNLNQQNNIAKNKRSNLRPNLPNRNKGINKNQSAINKLTHKKNLFPFKKNNNTTKNQTKETNTNSQDINNNQIKEETVITSFIKKKAFFFLIGAVLVFLGLAISLLLISAITIGPVVAFADFFRSINEDGLIADNNMAKHKYKVILKNRVNAQNNRLKGTNKYVDIDYVNALIFFKYMNELDDPEKSKEQIYLKMSTDVDRIVSLIAKANSTEYEIDSEFYNYLKESSDIKDYYQASLKTQSIDEILKSIFIYTSEAKKFNANMNGIFINDNLKVTMGTCKQPYNKQLLNEGTSYSSTVSFSKYIMGVIYGEIAESIKPENKEFLKAFTIVTSSYVLKRANYQPGLSEIWVHNGNCWQLSCDIDYGCHYTYDSGKYGTTYTGQGTGNYKPPMDASKKELLTDVLKEVSGILMIDKQGKICEAQHRDKLDTCISSGLPLDCLGQNDALNDAKNGLTYKEILAKYYQDFTLSNVKEDNYANSISYDKGGYAGEIVYYNQNDYHDRFCGISDETIKTSGCGPTSMAIVLSSLVNRNLTPSVVMQEAYSGGYCGPGISGTYTSFFKKSAKNHGLDYHKIDKAADLQVVLDYLEGGKSLVVAHMGPGNFTRSGHYMVLSRVNNSGQVYVLDPNAPQKNGWYDFNLIVKQLRGAFHIVTKR